MSLHSISYISYELMNLLPNVAIGFNRKIPEDLHFGQSDWRLLI